MLLGSVRGNWGRVVGDYKVCQGGVELESFSGSRHGVGRVCVYVWGMWWRVNIEWVGRGVCLCGGVGR